MSFENPQTILTDFDGNPLFASSSQALAVSSSALLMAGSGSDGLARLLKVQTDGALFVTGTVNASVMLSSVAQGNHGTADQSWYVVLTDGSSSIALGSAAASPLFITGAVGVSSIASPVTVTGSVVLGEQPITTKDAGSPGATVTNITASTSTITLLAANSTRTGAILYYNGSQNLFVKLGSGANTSSSYSVKMTAKSYYEVPGKYTGILTGIWDNQNNPNVNYVNVTEITNP